MSRLELELHRALASGQEPAPDDARLAELVRAADPLRSVDEVARSVAEIRAHLDGLGPIQPLLVDPDVTDIMINGAGPVWVERGGRLEATSLVLDRAEVDLLVERIVAPLGQRADPVHPLVDGRLADGSRVHVVVPPLAVDGPCITIRRFAVRGVRLEQFAVPPVVALLRRAVRARSNIVVSGATGSGKTTLLNALAEEVSAAERIVTVEDAAELRLGATHVVRLEARAEAPDGAPGVPIRELVRNALRMRPDRLVVGEVRGAEAFDLLSAMSTGHDGSLSTVHANSAADALARLANLVLLAGVGLGTEAIAAQLCSAIDLIVHVERGSGGARGVAAVAEPLLADPERGGGPGGVHLLADAAGVVDRPARAVRRAGSVA